ncbi:putative mitochondrial protein AtMg00300 [Silene latifolia]|uniref:putative mitochondrial protein AtMg00300 n=1 Tax=Silene latifolia TaxID=37657 RepID=UPI003D76FF6C
MCPHKHWFNTYESFNEGRVVVGNSATCEVVGIGSIKVKTAEDKKCTLTNVRHVPALGKNLISLSLLSDLGYEFQSKGEILSVTKGSSLVLKGVKQNSLYVLQGETLTNFASCASVNHKKKTKVWHKRLGHMGDRGIQQLCKRGLLNGVKVSNLEFNEQRVFDKKHRFKFSKSAHKTKEVSDPSGY